MAVKAPASQRNTIRAVLDVPTRELRPALQAVLPHASALRDDIVLGRIQLRWTDGRLLVMASDRYTVGLAHVSVLQHRDGPETGVVDITRDHAKKLIGLFKLAPKAKAGEVDELLRLEVTAEQLRVTEVGGLWANQEYALDRIGEARSYPELPELVAHALTMPRTEAPVVTLDGSRVARFHAAAKAYGTDLQVEPTGDSTALIVTAGTNFVGIVMPHTLTETEQVAFRGWRAEWVGMLPTPHEQQMLAVDVPLPSPKGGDSADAGTDPGAPAEDGVREATGGLRVVGGTTAGPQSPEFTG